MNLPNKLSLFRIVLIPFVVGCYLLSCFWVWLKLVALILFCVACLTDRLDGQIARKTNQITVLGTFLDSIADKMLVLSVFAVIVVDGTVLNPFGVISLIIILCRELLVSAIRQIGATKNVVISADMWGKVKATLQMVCIILFLIFGFIVEVMTLTSVVYYILFVLCYLSLFVTIVSTVLSAIHYLVKNKEVFR